MLVGVVAAPLPWNPNVNVPPAGMVVCQLGGVIVQALPLTAKVALQPLASVTPEGAVHRTVQPFRVLVPLLRTVTFVVKPCGQELCTA